MVRTFNTSHYCEMSRLFLFTHKAHEFCVSSKSIGLGDYIVGTDGFVLYHDGMTTGNIYKKEGDFDEFSNKNYE
jgi:hypothetical protein